MRFDVDLPFNGWDRQRLWRHLERRPLRAGPLPPAQSRLGAPPASVILETWNVASTDMGKR